VFGSQLLPPVLYFFRFSNTASHSRARFCASAI
jgi:hypothetical protein